MRNVLRVVAVLAGLVLLGVVGLHVVRNASPAHRRATWIDDFVARYKPNGHTRSLTVAGCSAVIAKARSLLSPSIRYDSAYQSIAFPNGDVPSDRGVCADVVVRSFRADGHDLQALLNEDMGKDFDSYPSLWHLNRPDPNIDHRRVPNLMTWFTRHGAVLPMTTNAADFQPCDIVAWDLGKGVTHIGVISDRSIDGTPAIIHHIGGHPTEEDVLFRFRMIGHFAF